MKTSCLLSILFAFTISLTAQDVKVPGIVKEVFTKLYPNAAEVKWSGDKKTGFEAEFKDQNSSVAVNFDADGKLLETETTIDKSALPKAVTEYVDKNYKGYSITEAAKIVDSKNVVTFEAEVTKNKLKKDIILTENGKLISKENSKEKD